MLSWSVSARAETALAGVARLNGFAMREMTMPATIIEAAQYRAMPWRNGLGTSLEIAAEPGGDGAAWRFGIAAIERSCPFSLYPGYDRTILLLQGRGLVLSFPDGGEPTRHVDD